MSQNQGCQCVVERRWGGKDKIQKGKGKTEVQTKEEEERDKRQWVESKVANVSVICVGDKIWGEELQNKELEESIKKTKTGNQGWGEVMEGGKDK